MNRVLPQGRLSVGWKFLASAVALTAASSAATAINPSLILIPFVFVAVAAGVVFPAAFLFGALSLVFAAGPIASVTGVSVIGSLEDFAGPMAAATLTTHRLLTGRAVRLPPAWGCFALFLGCGLASAIVHAVPREVVLLGALSALKPYLFAFAACQIEWSAPRVRFILRASAVTAGVVVIGVVLNFVFGAQWAEVFSRGAQLTVENAGGARASTSFFSRPGALGRFCDIAALVCLAVYLYSRRSLLVLALYVALLISVLATYQSKSIAGVLVGSLLLLATYKSFRVRLLSVISVVGAALFLYRQAVAFFGSDIETYIFDNSARARLTLGALDVAASNFPLGVGFGRYGSATAAQIYSPEYLSLGFRSVYGLSDRGYGQFLTDTAWPAILGETGWIGALSFAGLLFVFLRLFIRVRRANAPAGQWIGAAGVVVLIAILIESFAAPVFASAPAYPLVFVLAGLAKSLIQDDANARTALVEKSSGLAALTSSQRLRVGQNT